MEFTFDLQRFDSVFSGGSGTEADPYKISSVTDLQALVNYVNAGTDYNGTYFKLTADIDLKYSEWTPIGTNGEFPFKGTFDGGNHTISKLKVSEGNVNAGLFGINGGTIKNVTLTGVNVTGTSNVGGLVGTNVGTVDNCIVSGTVTGTSNSSSAGGLVGNNDTGTIKNSISVATVSVGSGSPYGGGLVGNNSGTVNGTNYYYTAPALGGESVSENCTKLYKLTLQTGVTVTGGIVVTDDGTTYAAGTLTLSATASNAVIKSTNYTNNDDGTVSVTLNADADLSNAVDFYYAVNIPNCVQSVSGTSYGGNYPNYYKNGSTLNLTAKTGYVVDNVTVSADTSITATLAQGHYAFSYGDGYTLATNANVAENNYPNLVQVYKLTLPEGVTVSGGIVVTDDGTTYAAGTLTLSATASNAVIKSTNYTNNDDGTVSVTLNADADLSNAVDFYYAVNIPNCVQSVSGTSYGGNYPNYYKNGSTLNLTAKTGYVVDNVTVSADTSITATLAQGHYAFSYGDGYTLATNANVAENNYPNLVQVYKLTLPEGVTVSGGIVVTDDGTTYAANSVTLAAAAGYILQNIKVNGESLDGNTFTVSADATVLADSLKFNNADISKATAVTVGGTTGDLSTFSGIYSITAAQENSTLVGNAKNNTIFIAGGDENILTGGVGNDTFKFGAGGGIVTDYGIGATKSGDGNTLPTASGSDIVKVSGKVSGVYFDRDASSKKTPTFTAIVTYDSDGDSTADEIIVLKDIAKKPTKTGSKPTYQTNDVAAAMLKIWDTSGTKQAVLSASKLKKLFRDDDELSTDLLTQVASLGNLDGIGDLNLPAVDQLTATTQTYSGGNDS